MKRCHEKEVIAGSDGNGHSFEVDAWALGVLAYALLVGRPPFETRDVQTTYKRIRGNEYAFPQAAAANLSDDAKDLVRWALQADPARRPTMLQVLHHPFVARRARAPAGPPPAPAPAEQLPEPRASGPSPPPACATPDQEEGERPKSSSPIDPDGCCSHPKKLGGGSAKLLPSPRSRPALSPIDPNSCASRPQLVALREDGGGSGREDDDDRGGGERAAARARAPNVVDARGCGEGGHCVEQTAPDDARAADEERRSARRCASPPSTSATAGLTTTTGRALEATHESLPTSTLRDDDGAHQSKAAPGRAAGQPIPPLRVATAIDHASRVSHWVDYSHKYGLGWLMVGGVAGVLFNDSTKIVLDAEGARYEYFEARCAEPVVGRLDGEPPAGLAKKAALLKHFASYLRAKREGDAASPRRAAIAASSGAPARSLGGEGRPPAHVRKWVRTPHCILLRLSNALVQVEFTDGSQLVLSGDGASAAYVDAGGRETEHALSPPPADPSLLKRLKYVRSVLGSMSGRNTSSSASSSEATSS